ncbi:MAG: bifunctional preprotein translocase subunit SecD/SecF [Bacteroidetes bacterium ADurb.Bin217]|nr:MAG: bifunctional preprotein translocase subunit SecD/SecF [Bacteroidetes bacterium ADurb.Bin217]
MQNKGFIRVFAILLVLAALYSLSFTYYTWKASKDADAYAQGDTQKRKEFLDSLSQVDDYYNFLGLRKFSYADCQQHELNLGLDLKGGMNVTLQISVKDMILNLSNEGADDTILIKTLQRADVLERESKEEYVALFGKAFAELYPNKSLRTFFIANEDMQTKITFNSSNEEVLAVLSAEAKAAIDNSFNIIRTRIDRFGVTQPNIQNLGGGRILVELPGVQDQDRVRDLLQSSAKLEFWETYNNSEVYQVVFEINKALAALNTLKETKDTTKTTAKAVTADTVKKEELSLKEQLKQDTTKLASADSTKSKEEIERENPLFSRFIPNISQDGRPGVGPVIGFAQKSDLATIDSILAMPEVREIIDASAPELKLTWSKKANENDFYSLVALKDLDRDGKASLEGDVVVDARPEFSQMGGSASVRMVMNSDGAKEWRRLTKENIERSVAIVLDGYVYSFPTVQTEISDGISSITGNFTIPEATDLANILKSGKLSAAAEIMNAEFVGPSLGQESISKGMISFLVAFFIVLLYMLLYYQKAGLVANIALMLNLFLIFGVLASLGAVLTLPGIAGIVLTLGMAVDANVIIYERIREEMAQGKGIKLAIADGFKNAYSAIIDANVTTIIIAIILYLFGKGPIQGFATTLIIGVLTSLFCGIFITRLVFERMLTKKRAISFDTKLTRNAFKNVNFDFIGTRKTYYILSSIIIIVGIGSMVVRQWNVGVDFKGGRSYIVQLEDNKNTGVIEKSLAVQFGKAPEVKSFGDSEVKITTDFMINEKGASIDSTVEAKLFEGLKPVLPQGTDIDGFMKNNLRQSDMVGPTIANDIIWGAIISVVLALLFVFLYIFVRFRNWQFGMGAVAALFHDVLIVLGIFSLLHGIVPFSLEIGQSFIAAILTVIGYSINDTVIVFDRVREITNEFPKRQTSKLFNQGLNSTISRTVNTSATTILVLLIIFIFGGDSIKGFVFAMLIGIVIGTYSSLFVASSITFDLLKRQKKIVE